MESLRGRDFFYRATSHAFSFLGQSITIASLVQAPLLGDLTYSGQRSDQ